MARPREFDQNKVMCALRDVFWERGYEGTSYADIMQATGLKKGSLYSAFGDKRALYMAALHEYDKAQVSKAVSVLRDSNLTSKQRVTILFDGLVEAAQTRQGRWGCFLCNAASDQAPFDKPTERAVTQSMDRMKVAMEVALDGTQAHDKCDLILSIYFGARVRIKSGASKATLINLKNQTLSLL